MNEREVSESISDLVWKLRLPYGDGQRCFAPLNMTEGGGALTFRRLNVFLTAISSTRFATTEFAPAIGRSRSSDTTETNRGIADIFSR
jgi:hypothetical protein